MIKSCQNNINELHQQLSTWNSSPCFSRQYSFIFGYTHSINVLRSINISVNVELVKMRTILELTDGRFVRHPANIASIVFSSIVIFLCRYIRHLILEFKLFDDISWRKFPIYSPSYFKTLTILSSCLLLGVRNIIKSINFYSFMYKDCNRSWS